MFLAVRFWSASTGEIQEDCIFFEVIFCSHLEELAWLLEKNFEKSGARGIPTGDAAAVAHRSGGVLAM